MWNVQDCADLQQRGKELQQRWYSPAPIPSDVDCADGDSCRQDTTNVVRAVEQGGQDRSLLGMTQFSDQTGAGDDAEQDAESQDHSGYDIHRHWGSTVSTVKQESQGAMYRAVRIPGLWHRCT